MHTFWYWYGAGGVAMFLLQAAGVVFFSGEGRIILSKEKGRFFRQTYLFFTMILAKSIIWPATIVYETESILKRRFSDSLIDGDPVDLTKEEFGAPTGDDAPAIFNAAFERAQKALLDSPGGPVHAMVFASVLILMAYVNAREFFVTEHGETEDYAKRWFAGQVRLNP